MNQKLTRKYRLTAHQDFFGDIDTTHLRNWLHDWRYSANHIPKIVIFHGGAGLGKTTLAMVLSKNIMPILYTNASDSRKKADLQRIYMLMGSNTFKKNCLFVMDEIDQCGYLSKKELLKTINPIILITNDYYKLPQWMKDFKGPELESYKFDYPKRDLRVKYTKFILERESIQNIDIDKIVDNSVSFRDILTNIDTLRLEGQVIKSDTKDMTPFDVLKNISHGAIKLDDKIDMEPSLLIAWLFDNTRNMDSIFKIQKVDQWLRACRDTGDYRLWKYAYSVLYSCKGCRVGVPYSFGIKKDKANNKDSKIDNSKRIEKKQRYKFKDNEKPKNKKKKVDLTDF